MLQLIAQVLPHFQANAIILTKKTCGEHLLTCLRKQDKMQYRKTRHKSFVITRLITSFDGASGGCATPLAVAALQLTASETN